MLIPYVGGDIHYPVTWFNDAPSWHRLRSPTCAWQVPAEYDHNELILWGWEEQDINVIYVKRILKTKRLDDPNSETNVGLCLLGPANHHPYRVTIVFADTRMTAQARYADLEFLVNSYDEAYIAEEFDTKEERENFIKEHAVYIDESVGDRIIRS